MRINFISALKSIEIKANRAAKNQRMDDFFMEFKVKMQDCAFTNRCARLNGLQNIRNSKKPPNR